MKTLLVDAEHNETFLIDSLDTAPRKPSVLYLPKHRGWIEVERKVSVNGVRLVVKQSVRWDSWSRDNNYRWLRAYAPVEIWFGVAEQAERRHAGPLDYNKEKDYTE